VEQPAWDGGGAGSLTAPRKLASLLLFAFLSAYGAAQGFYGWPVEHSSIWLGWDSRYFSRLLVCIFPRWLYGFVPLAVCLYCWDGILFIFCFSQLLLVSLLRAPFVP
jgi:hypothetical protein